MIVLQKIAAPRAFVRCLRWLTPWLAYEIDDAIYLGYPGSERSAHETRDRVSYAISLAERVVTSNRQIASDISSWTQSPGVTRVFPGPAPALRNFDPLAKSQRRVLWLGSPSTYPYFLEGCAAVCPTLAIEGFDFAVVGAPSDPVPIQHVDQFLWDAQVESRELELASVGLMPMATDAWAVRKAAYKLLEYLASDIVPVYVRSTAVDTLLGNSQSRLGIAIEDGSPAAWIDGIRRASEMRVDQRWRARRDAVFERWSPERFAAQFLPKEG